MWVDRDRDRLTHTWDNVEVWLYLKVTCKSWDFGVELEEGHEIDPPAIERIRVYVGVWNVDGDRMWTKRAHRPVHTYCATEDFEKVVTVYAD
jgi:hypothetical protein